MPLCSIRHLSCVLALSAVASFASAQAPANDNCPGAIALAGPGPTFTWSSTNATSGNLEAFPTCLPTPIFGPQSDVWYRWTSPQTGPVTLDTLNTPFDTRLVVYANNPCTALGVPVACNDDISATVVQSSVNFNAVAGTTYILRVGSFFDGVTGNGFFNINFATTGACCAGVTCSVSTSAACVGTNRQFRGVGSACNVSGNNTAPCCRGDFNQDGTRAPADIFAFLNGYFSATPAERALADTDGSGANEPGDIFAYLNLYFAGGC